MAWLYDFLIDAGVAPEPASWGVVIITCLCFYSIFKVVMSICK